MKLFTNLLLLTILYFTSTLYCQGEKWINFYGNPPVLSQVADKDNVWECTEAGLVKIDISTLKTTLFQTSNTKLPDNKITSITIDKKNNKWIGTLNGLVKYDGVNWTIFNTSNSPLPLYR